MHRKTLLWILLISGFLSGCSFTSLLYNNAPWWVREKVDDYFSITSAQQRQLDRDIETFFEWHRYQELPEYADFISTFNRQFADGLTREELVVFFDQIAAARSRFAEVSLGSASQFLAGISDKQLEYFDREFQQKLDKDRKKASLPIEELNERRFSRLLDNLEDWFGDFDAEQKLALRKLSDKRENNGAFWLEKREQRHQQFLKFLREKPNADAIRTYLRSRYTQRFNQTTNDDDKQVNRFWLTASLRIDKIITPKQRRRAISRLDEYRQDFIYLSQLGPDELNVKTDP